jgi:methyltransferase (TIGR00027 family)
MEEHCPSTTALRVALRRAAHQLLDEPTIFHDPLATRILGLETDAAPDYGQEWLEQTPLARVLRTSLAVRSQCVEDEFRAAHDQGIDQLVILGAGLDTFAYRNVTPDDMLQIFEVDHPATQSWKRSRLEEAGIPLPRNLTFVPIDFETQTLQAGLAEAGFDSNQPAFFSWLGVSMYLSSQAIAETLHYVASLPAESHIVFDYLIEPSTLNPSARKAFDGLAARVAAAGEPFLTFFEPLLLAAELRAMGFGHVVDIAPEQLDAQYCTGRTDGLRAGKLSHIMHARV